jgi:hypothetical protein
MFRSFFTTIFRGSSAVLCAVTILPAGLQQKKQFYLSLTRICYASEVISPLSLSLSLLLHVAL